MSKPIDKKKKQVEEQIFYHLMQIVQNYPQYNVAQHLAHILRKRGDAEEAYYWDDEKLLRRFEDYHDELDRELNITAFCD